MSRVAIVTDSTSDLDPAVAEKHRIGVVPLFINFGDRRFLDDGIEITRAEFYRKMREEKTLPTTSQPTAAKFEETYAPLVEAGRPIVGVYISSKLSGTINAARAGAQPFKGADIRFVDSRTCTGGTGLLAIKAAEMAERGASADEIVDALDEAIVTQRGVCTVPDLSHVTRTGRVGKAASLVGGLLKIVPVLRLDRGETEVEARVRTYARAKETLADVIVAAAGNRERARIVIMHAQALGEAESLAAMVREKLGVAPHSLEINEAGPAIAVHAGAGAIGAFSLAG